MKNFYKYMSLILKITGYIISGFCLFLTVIYVFLPTYDEKTGLLLSKGEVFTNILIIWVVVGIWGLLFIYLSKRIQKKHISDNAFSKIQTDETSSHNEIPNKNVYENLDLLRILSSSVRDEEIKKEVKQISDISVKLCDNKNISESEKKSMNRFYNIYLPKTVNLISSYKDIEDGLDTNKIKQTKEALKNTLINLNKAFNNLYIKTFDDDITSLEVEMDTMESIVNMDGLLSDNDFGEILKR